METFKAGVQYGDWEGTAAADGANATSIEDYLESKGLIKEDEFLIAVKLWVGENHGGKLGSTFVRALLVKGQELESVRDALNAIAGEIPVRSVDVAVTLEEFVGLFKRFDVALTWSGLELGERKYRVIEE
jgi:hypothetical protein